MCCKNKTCPFNPQLQLASWANEILNILRAMKMLGLLMNSSANEIFHQKYFEIFVWDEKAHLLDSKGHIYRFETCWNISRFFKISLDISRWEILTSWFLKKWTSQFLESRDISLCEIPLFCNNSEFYLFLLKTVHCGTQRKEKGSSRKEKLFPSHVISLHIPWPQSKLINFDMYCTYWLKGWPG